MVARRNELDDALAGCGPDTIRRSVGLLRSVMAVQQVDDETKKLQRAAYLQVLSPYPAWAVETACMQFLAASRGEGIHAPKPGEIAAVCRVLVAEGRAERARINAVLDAEIVPAPTEEDRKRVQERYEAFMREATARAADTKAMLDSRKSDILTEDRQAALDDLKRREERRLAEEEKA